MRKPSERPLEASSLTDVMPGNGTISPTSPSAERHGLSSPAPSRSPQPVLRQQAEGSSQGQRLPLSNHDAIMTAHRSSDPAPDLSGAANGQAFELGDAARPLVPTSALGVLGLGAGSSDSGKYSAVQGAALGSKMASAAAAFSRRGGRRRK